MSRWNYSTQSHLEAIVGPAAELHFAALVVEGEPRDVDLARRFENPRRNIQTRTVVSHYHVRWVSAIKSFVGAAG